jgi:glycosyltransferase involved in cell wall biosynthesis
MRIVIDMQGAQSSTNSKRGIGRYTMSLVLALVRNRGEHEIFLAINGGLPDSIEHIRTVFSGLLPQGCIKVWNASDRMSFREPENDWHRKSGELVREAFLFSLKPDFVLITSLFEGLVDNSITSIKLFSGQPLTAVIFYDLIPLINRQIYLDDPVVESWYLEKIEYLRRADLLLGISNSTCQEGIKNLKIPADRCINISTDADNHFKQVDISAVRERAIRQKYNLPHPFVMYTGGIDHRKNIEALICAYSKLSPQLRKNHQLAIICSVHDADRQRLIELAKTLNLSEDELIFTGFVSEEDLVALYNLCTLFVFPSWHEGFGLPALEAMRCGAPVIASDASSLREVVGLKDALFDPHSVISITRSIERALTDKEFRTKLRIHGQKQSTKFSWDETALRALTAMQSINAKKHIPRLTERASKRKPRLAYVSPLPPEKSGISDYSSELLHALACHYEIEVIVEQDYISDDWVKANCLIRTTQWFRENGDHFDRVLYHFGNSAFHQHMFELLVEIPGVVVLHDFYLSGVLHYMDATGYAPNSFQSHLYKSHGYASLLDYSQASDISDIIWKYPCSYTVIECSLGTIVHSENSIRLGIKWYALQQNDMEVIPLLRSPAEKLVGFNIRRSLNLSDSCFIVCSFGHMGKTKLNHRLLKTWLESDLAMSKDCCLIFVGENDRGVYGDDLTAFIREHPNGDSVRITGWVEMEDYRKYLSTADLAVQLRTLSRGETSAAVLDCMNYGLATIANANGSMADLDSKGVWLLPDEFDDQQLTDALQVLWTDHDRRRRLGSKAKNIINDFNDPVKCADKYKNVIEDFYAHNCLLLNGLVEKIAETSADQNDANLVCLAGSIARNFLPRQGSATIFVDISELVQRDAKSGIQRVVRNILKEWLLEPPFGYRIEPVYASPAGPYRLARAFTFKFLDISFAGLNDDPIEYAPGDIFFGLDFCPTVQVSQRKFYQDLRNTGVSVKFMVYDLLCITHQEYFVDGAKDGFTGWLDVVAENDGIVCISNTVASEFRKWTGANHVNMMRRFELSVNHLASEICKSSRQTKNSISIPIDLKGMRQGANFVMVGTVEPRKGHIQVFDAFEHLWTDGIEANLIIVGKQGWMMEDFISRIKSHKELGKKFVWLNDVDDESLVQIYEKSICLIAASYGEGFGLPLVEAAKYKLPIIARDIPIFREVVGENAFFFNAVNSQELKNSLLEWLELYKFERHPKSSEISLITWKQSSYQLISKLVNKQDQNIFS